MKVKYKIKNIKKTYVLKFGLSLHPIECLAAGRYALMSVKMYQKGIAHRHGCRPF